MTFLATSPIDTYCQYLDVIFPRLTSDALLRLKSDLCSVNWEEPATAIDFNNFAVLALIEAEHCTDLSLRAMQVDMALQALQTGAALQPSHPLCLAHLALVQSMLGNTQMAIDMAYSGCITSLQTAYAGDNALPLGLVYLPPGSRKARAARQELLPYVLQSTNGAMQALQIMAETLRQSQLAFYTAGGIRFLRLAHQLLPDSAAINLQLGLASWKQGLWEGLGYLQRSRQLTPDSAITLQVLYLAYRALEETETALYWQQVGQQVRQQIQQKNQQSPQQPSQQHDRSKHAWCWTELPLDSPFTYISVAADDLLLAVEPSFQSIVTSVLLAEGDWFEAEMEFWRNQIKPSMTVIDVGANVGVYTFSAAQRVGATGRVFAIEPFAGCVQCLQETRRINQLDWVVVCQGAASDRQTTARLSLHGASELNEVIIDKTDSPITDSPKTDPNAAFAEITCFTLDSLVEQEQITQVDWLKIDAEGHEMQVLQGSERLIAQFSPGILYENIAGDSGSNLPVAKYLQAKGYQLFCYQPYLADLIPVQSIAEVQGKLNIIALPPRWFDR